MDGQTALVISGITDRNKLACLSRARRYAQYCRGVEEMLAGRCPFCQIDRDYNQIIFEDPNCMAWPCRPPEDHTAKHFLIVPRRHVTGIQQLRQDEMSSAITAYLTILTKYGIKSCGVLIRDGDATLSAGSIEHLHVHMMVPDGSGRVAPPFFKGAESEAESLARAIVFEKLRTGTQESDLSPEERALVAGRT